MKIKNITIFLTFFLACCFIVGDIAKAAGETSSLFFGGTERSGNQYPLYLESAIPSGDALREAGLFLMDMQSYLGDTVMANDIFLENIQALLDTAATCKDTSICAANQDNESCSPSNLCDLKGLDESYAKLQNSNKSSEQSSENYFALFNKPELVTADIYKLGDTMFENTASSSIHYFYKDFYADFNRILAPHIIPSYTLPSPNYKLANRLERVKRKLDLARFGLHACVTPTITDSEIKNIDEGQNLLKEPLRIDFLLANQANLPDDPTNVLDYFCYSYQDF